MLSLKRKYSRLIAVLFLSGSIVTLLLHIPASSDISMMSVRIRNSEVDDIETLHPILPKPPQPRQGFQRSIPQDKQEINIESTQRNAKQQASSHVQISSQTSHSYRALPRITGWMETNKIHDDYNFCPRIEPFLGPFNFDSRTKNPCWNDTGVFRCLPYFYIAGFSKCGTSDLFFKLVQHPEVAKSGVKEKHWFDYFRFVADTRFIQNYTDKFINGTSHIESEVHQTGYSNKITVDGTPCYVWGSLNWPCYEGNQGLSEPLFTNADVIYRMNPKARIIISMREPVKRLYSRMLTWIAEPLHPAYVNSTPEKFHTFIVERIQMYRQCFSQWTHRQCAYNGTLYQEAVLRLAEGAYSIYVKDWLQVFPREQLLFIKFEDYVHDLNATLRRVHRFLELSPLTETEMQKILNSGTANAGKHYNIGPMENKTKTILQEFYQPFNEELAQILNDPHMTWTYGEGI
ncbi:hypothetical protein BsWGS_21954 [Bradybaena similaris]